MEKSTFELTLDHTPPWLNNFINVYQSLSTDNLDLLETVYHENITFIDPIQQVKGVKNLRDYFNHLYENLSQCDFVIKEVIADNNKAAIYWDMTYIHPKLNKGNAVTTSGTSQIRGQDDKVIYHRDYLDVGVMLYEQLPIIGRLIKWIKAKSVN